MYPIPLLECLATHKHFSLRVGVLREDLTRHCKVLLSVIVTKVKLKKKIIRKSSMLGGEVEEGG